MKPVLRCLATSFGSAGDFLPTLAVAGALRRRGHEVTFVANPLYASRVERAGVDFVPAGERLDIFERIERTPSYVDLASAAMLFRDFGEPDTEAVYRVARERMRAAPLDVVLTSDVSFGAMWAAAAHRLPNVVVTASPVLWMGWESPVMFGDGAIRTVLARPLTVMGRSFMRWYMGRLLRPLARRVGAPSPDVSFPAWEHSAALRLGLWSPVLRAQLASDPPNSRVCGYVRASGLAGAEPGLPPEVRAFLDEGPPPVVVGLGSVIGLTAGALLVSLAQACADVGRRCLVIGHPAGMTSSPETLAVRWAPYDQVFSSAAAVVVHGGSGTTGEALRSGRPIVGVPVAYDQFTLCESIERLGVGVRVPLARRSRRDLAAVLERVLSDAAMQDRAASAGARFAAEPDGAVAAAEEIERRFDGRRSS
jgi:UDP:flavonoid glycosyltransferase YjiC (YdhE family)